MSADQNQPKSEDQVLADFKAEWVKKDSGVLDAWIDRGFIVWQVDLDKFGTENMPKVPGEYQGIPTVLTLFEKPQS